MVGDEDHPVAEDDPGEGSVRAGVTVHRLGPEVGQEEVGRSGRHRQRRGGEQEGREDDEKGTESRNSYRHEMSL